MHNITQIVELTFLLLAILAACLIFSNAVEHLGEKLNLGNQVTGSILAAVGTALPETIVPMVAIFLVAEQAVNAVGQHANSAAHDIAIGSIIGAPFLLSTLAFWLMGTTVWFFRKKRGTTDILVDFDHLQRDLIYFLMTFGLAVLASVAPAPAKVAIVVLLGLTYAFYVFQTIKGSRDELANEEVDLPKLYLCYLKLPDNLFMTVVQIILGLIGIIFFAEKFVHALKYASEIWSVSPLVLSLIITPIATELPEKFNSCIWSAQKKDTLAMGNLTGAMVFQSAIPCTIGILFTEWKLDSLSYICAGLSIFSALVLLMEIKFLKKLTAYSMMLAGGLYLIYIYLAFFS